MYTSNMRTPSQMASKGQREAGSLPDTFHAQPPQPAGFHRGCQRIQFVGQCSAPGRATVPGLPLPCPRASTGACTHHHNPKRLWTNTRHFCPSQVSDTRPDGLGENIVLGVFLFQNKAYLQTTEQMCQHPVPKTKIHNSRNYQPFRQSAS